MLMPVFFIGHGSPMNALQITPFSRNLEAMGKNLADRPRAILVVSAHWLSEGTLVNSTPHPETIYDFYGFPEKLYQIKYAAPGAPEFAREVIRLIPEVIEDRSRGLDHGAWVVLKYIFPEADIPVFQLSIDFHRPMQYHYDLSQKLRSLRQEGFLVIGSGNIVHNLRLVYSREDNSPYDWAIEFDAWVKDRIDQRDFASLIHYEKMGTAAHLSVPTVDHYAPLIYALALAEESEEIIFTYEEVFTSMSMRCLQIG
jgi:4,5-DOPA dioxygenase extradiol